jgi:hypothetical protein
MSQGSNRCEVEPSKEFTSLVLEDSTCPDQYRYPTIVLFQEMASISMPATLSGVVQLIAAGTAINCNPPTILVGGVDLFLGS